MDIEKGNSVSSAGHEVGGSGRFFSFTQLSGSLQKLLHDAEFDYSDAEIVVEGTSVGVNRCILASRSPFFHELFKKGNDTVSANESKPSYVMEELVPHGKIGYEAFLVFLNYVYTGKLKPSPLEVSTCVDESCAHDACGPAINYAVELMYASATFQMEELVLVVQRRLLNFVDKALVEDVIPIVVVALHQQLNALLSYCIQRIAHSNVDNLTLEKQLPHEVLTDIKCFRKQPNQDLEHVTGEANSVYDKRIRRIHKALDSARRKDPLVIISLLSKGAYVSDSTIDGQSSITICRRLTRRKDYNESIKPGQETNKDRLCIDVLEKAMLRNPLAGTLCMSSIVVGDDLIMKLLILENRVAYAQILFPQEAMLAMEIANVHSTSAPEFSRPNMIDLNEIPYEQVKQLQLRLQALQKSVEIGRHFFPNCSLVLDKFLEDHMQEILMFNSPEKEQTKKKMPYLELKLEVMNASDEDKGESNWLSISTSISSCSSSTKASVDINVRKRKSTSSIDGQMSTTICQRFTQPMDFKETTNAMTGDISMSSMVLADDVVMRLLLLENRASIIRALLPSEVKLAMEIADTDSSSEFHTFAASSTLCGNLKTVDLNESPLEQEKRLQAGLQALGKAVEKGRQFYPSCCEVLGKFLENDAEDVRIKEIKEEITKAFETDKARIHSTHFSAPSPSETDTDFLLEKFGKLLKGINITSKRQTTGLDEAMMVFNNIDKDRNFSSSSSSGSISSVNQGVGLGKRSLC
ncbi:BTB/POZ domain and ankyrin repeat-containing protein NPR1-like isoform X2 [Coffea arabica]|uniref:BTB/POZ domain and ankyrin repeat-containing protein NPR1-like isoform X2 n=1 Tax=Coffea arabica TaxID=13443 RepID=A0ABM4UAU8_COFAR